MYTLALLKIVDNIHNRISQLPRLVPNALFKKI